MELKEPCTPQEIAEWAMKAANQSEGMSLSQATRILTMIESYGNNCYNQALTSVYARWINNECLLTERDFAELKKQ